MPWAPSCQNCCRKVSALGKAPEGGWPRTWGSWVDSGGLGSGLGLPLGALGPSSLFPLGLSLLLYAGRTSSSPLVLGLPLSVVSLVHLQAPLTPLSSAFSEVPSLHQRSWGLQERVEGAVRGLFRQPPALLCAPPLFLSSRGRRIFPVKQPDLLWLFSWEATKGTTSGTR